MRSARGGLARARELLVAVRGAGRANGPGRVRGEARGLGVARDGLRVGRASDGGVRLGELKDVDRIRVARYS